MNAKVSRNVGLVNNIETWGINSIPFKRFATVISTPLFLVPPDPTQTDLLKVTAQALKNARLAGMKTPGVWFPVAGGEDYADRTSQVVGKLDEYATAIGGSGPGFVMHDFEKGSGDAAWMLREWKLWRQLRKRTTAICVEPHQDENDVPYMEMAAVGGLAGIYIECFGVSPAVDHRDPMSLVGFLLGLGVDHRLLHPMVAAWGLSSFFAPKMASTGAVGNAFYLMDNFTDLDYAAYSSLPRGGVVPTIERRADVTAYL